jgi:hypothetical protein
VYADVAGNRTITVLDNLNNIVQRVTLSLPAGESRAVLNFQIPQGTNYAIKVDSINPISKNGLSRTQYGGTNYPYTVKGLVSILKTDVSASPTNNYYYFFDWEVSKILCTSNRVPVNAIIYLPSTPGSISGTNSSCPESVNSYSINPVNYAISYSWTLPSGWLGTSATNSISATSSSTSGTITVKATNACGSSIAGSQGITVKSVDVSITANGNTISANATGASYKWFNCETKKTIASQTNKTYTPSSSGNYAVIVTQNNCVDTSTCYNVIITSVDESSDDKKVVIYPNPSVNGKFTFEIIATNKGGTLEIYNAIGENVYSSSLNMNATKNEIDLTSQPSGIYLFQIKTERGIISKKLIINH